jgi:hypothetical protein
LTSSINVKGTARATLFLDAEGDVVKEIDTFSGFVTYTSDTGTFRFPLAQPIIVDYGEGAENRLHGVNQNRRS